MKERLVLMKNIGLVLLFGLAAGCSSAADNPGPTGTSINGYQVAVSVRPTVVPADGASQATVRVEVKDTHGNYADGLTVHLTSSLGLLASSDVTVTKGVATTTLTSGKTSGLARVVATVEDVSATGRLSLVDPS